MDGWDGLKAFQIKVPLYLNHLDERMTPIQMKRTHLCMEFLNAEALQQLKLQHMPILYKSMHILKYYAFCAIQYSHQAPSLLNIVQ